MQQQTVILDQVEVIKLDVTIWSARKKLRPEDLMLTDGSKLPPDELASLGSMRIVDREKLKIFDTLKKRAESLCLKYGVRFLGGYALPVNVIPSVIPELDMIQSSFNQHRGEFLISYQEYVDDWIGRYPDFAEAIRRHVDSSQSVGNRLSFEYVVFKVSTPTSDSGSLERTTGYMGNSLFREIAQEASSLLDNSFLGKQEITRKALSPIRKMRDKLDGLGFLDYRVNPVVDTIDRLLGSIPKTGKIEGDIFDRVFSLVLLLSDADKMRRHGEGLVDVQGQGFAPDLSVFGSAALPALPDAEETEDGTPKAVQESAPIPSVPEQAHLAFEQKDEAGEDHSALFAEFDALMNEEAGEETHDDAAQAAKKFVSDLKPMAPVENPDQTVLEEQRKIADEMAKAVLGGDFFF